MGRLKKLDYSWGAAWDEDICNYYVKASVYQGNNLSNDTYYIHRIIMDAEKSKYVDHKDFNTLNNRKSNLRITTQDKNSQHKSSKNKNNKSGYRNVFWNSTIEKWTVTLMKHYVHIKIGDFDDLEEAAIEAEQARKNTLVHMQVKTK